MRKDLKQVLLSFLILISCNSNKNSSLNNLSNLYFGAFDLHSKTAVDNNGQKQNYTQLISAQNNLIEDGWLLPEAMANNCAILLYLSNKTALKTNAFLEVEIVAHSMDPFSYQYTSVRLDSLLSDYLLVDTVIKEFIASARSNDIPRAKSIGYNIINQQEQGFISFIDEFREFIPIGFEQPKIVGYLITKNGNGFDYLVDLILPAGNNQRKWIHVSLVKVNEQIKIKEIKF